MHILVTGDSGVGRPTVEWLVDRHAVRVLESRSTGPSTVPSLEGDITDFASLGPMMAGIDAVIHLAAIPDPDLGPEHTIFHVNVGGTFNVLQRQPTPASGVWSAPARSTPLGTTTGIAFPEGQLRYFPIDEAHPTYTTDPYSFSKRAIEIRRWRLLGAGRVSPASSCAIPWSTTHRLRMACCCWSSSSKAVSRRPR